MGDSPNLRVVQRVKLVTYLLHREQSVNRGCCCFVMVAGGEVEGRSEWKGREKKLIITDEALEFRARGIVED